jgi:hypothetical protein
LAKCEYNPENVDLYRPICVPELSHDESGAAWTCVPGTLRNISKAADIRLQIMNAYISDCGLMVPSVICLYSWGSADVSSGIKYLLYEELNSSNLVTILNYHDQIIYCHVSWQRDK